MNARRMVQRSYFILLTFTWMVLAHCFAVCLKTSPDGKDRRQVSSAGVHGSPRWSWWGGAESLWVAFGVYLLSTDCSSFSSRERTNGYRVLTWQAPHKLQSSRKALFSRQIECFPPNIVQDCHRNGQAVHVLAVEKTIGSNSHCTTDLNSHEIRLPKRIWYYFWSKAALGFQRIQTDHWPPKSAGEF